MTAPLPRPSSRQAGLTEYRNLKMARSAEEYVRGTTRHFYERLVRRRSSAIAERAAGLDLRRLPFWQFGTDYRRRQRRGNPHPRYGSDGGRRARARLGSLGFVAGDSGAGTGPPRTGHRRHPGRDRWRVPGSPRRPTAQPKRPRRRPPDHEESCRTDVEEPCATARTPRSLSAKDFGRFRRRKESRWTRFSDATNCAGW